MAEIRNEGESGEEKGNDSEGRLLFGNDPRGDPTRPSRDRARARVWRRPGAGAVPTRPVTDLFDFSSADSADEDASGDVEVDPVWLEARCRAFKVLDEWLAWYFVVDDESDFAPGEGRSRNARFEFTLDDVIADPADVLHYSLRTFSVFL